MKNKILTLLICCIATLSFSQSHNRSKHPSVQVMNSAQGEIVLNIETGEYNLARVETPNGIQYIVNAEGASSLLHAAAPDIPCLSVSVIVPDNGSFTADVTYSDFEDIENVLIAPSKGSLSRSIDPATVPYSYGSAYQNDAFFPGSDLPVLSDPFILRDFRGITVMTYPFQYNPVTKVLRIYKNVSVRIVNNHSAQAVNELFRTKSLSVTDSDFDKLYNDFFVNYRNNPLRYTSLEEGTPGNILILCKNTYLADMADYVQWKTEKGFHVELVDVAEAGTNANAIKSFVLNYFNTNGITYLLLVGDSQHIPAVSASSGDSDNSYAYVLGSDGYADFFVGRFSGESSANIQTQVQRTIQYERDLDASAIWLENAFGSASNEGQGQGHDGGESDVTHMNNIKTDLENYGYTVTSVYQDGGNNAQITAAFNSGIGLANYIGHGDVDQWVNTTFTNNNVNQLLNENKLPFIFSVACINGDFAGQTCFAEAWLRATKNGNPTGALAFLGSTINQSWAEPMTAQDEMNDVLVESYNHNIKRTFAGIAFAGMFLMIEEGGQGQAMADTWSVFGDPSVMVRTKTPQAMAVSHDPVFSVGATDFTVNCDVEGALVALSTLDGENTVLLGSAYVSAGSAQVTIPAFSAPGTMKVTVTAYNRITYQGDVTIIVPDGPYVVLDQVLIDDSDANNNLQIDYNEIIYLGLELTNVGVEVASNVVVTTSSESPLVDVTDNTQTIGDITVSETITEEWAFTAVFSDGIADQTMIPFTLLISGDNENSWNTSYNLRVNAPSLAIDFIGVNDDGTGNGNGLLDPGETVQLMFRLSNNGHSDALEGSLTYSVSGPCQTSGSPLQVDAMVAGGNGMYSIGVTIDEEAESGSLIGCNLIYDAGAYSKSLAASVPVGLQIEDWESADLTSFAWQNDASHPWFITESNPYEGNNCLQSGDLPESGGESALILVVDVVADDNISFYKKVSCEPSSWGYYWDFLAFYIDDVMKGQWAGTVAWSNQSYPVTAGLHELKWTYEKDSYQTNGSDCAWLDLITLPAHSQNVAIQYVTADIEEFNMKMFPNPANDVVNISALLPENGIMSIEMYSVTGQYVKTIVREMEFNEGSAVFHFSVNELPTGFYIVVCRYGNTSYTMNLSVIR
ncbi:MAG TPA: C25 family cysteine peptidase [Bacteroidales bacterium]|nr:C25 family cysteine peptidase [Bacteroidales bacterium]